MNLIDHLIDVYVVLGDAGNIGGGRILGVFIDAEQANKAAIGRGSLDCGGDGIVEKRKGYIENDKVYLIDEPVLLNKIVCNPRYRPDFWKPGQTMEEKYSFDVVLKAIEKPVETMRILRVLFNWDLKSLKNIVTNLPTIIARDISADYAKEIKEKLQQIGATIEIK